jgi:hypothetical protein
MLLSKFRVPAHHLCILALSGLVKVHFEACPLPTHSAKMQLLQGLIKYKQD